MLAPLAAIRPHDPGHGGGQQRRAEDGDVQPPASPLLLGVRAGRDLQVHVEVGGDLLDGRPQAADRASGAGGRTPGVRDEDAQGEAASDDDLLHVGHDDREPGQYGEQPRGDARAIRTGQRDQERALVHVV